MAQFATVVAINGNGTVLAVDAQGKTRTLKVGDHLQKGETIRTVGDTRVELMMEDGHLMGVAAAQSVRLDENVVQSDQRPTAQDSAVANPTTADTVIQALERGTDLNLSLEATAAGLAPGGAVDGGSTFVNLLRITEGVSPLAYDYTFAAPSLQPLIQAIPEIVQPTISVGVTVGTPPGTGEGGTGVITGGIVQAGVTAIDVPEGTGGTKAVTFLITLDKVSATDVTITYTVVPGTASNPADYYDGTTTKTVTIPAGATGFAVTEYIVGDTLVEANETFKIVLSNPIGATLVNDTATVTIIDDDHAPVAQNDAVAMTEDDLLVTGNVLSNDTDQDGQVLAVVNPSTIVNQYGALVIKADGSYTFTPNEETHQAVQSLTPDQSLVINFVGAYQATDGTNLSNLADVKITINGTNDAPVAVADTNWAKEDTSLTASGNVLTNNTHAGAPTGTFADHADTDVDTGTTLAVTAGTFTGTYGTLVLAADGTYTYTLNNAAANVQALGAGQTATDTFNYTTTDGTATASSTLTVTVFGTNDAPTISIGQTTIVSEEGLIGANPDNIGSPSDTTNSTTASGQFTVADVDSGTLTVVLTAPVGTFTSGGQPILWTLSNSGHTLTGATASATIIVVTIDNTGAYNVTLSGPIDHSAPPVGTSVENLLSLGIGVTVSDGSLSASSTLTVTIEDDSPIITAQSIDAYRTAGDYIGTYDFHVGADVTSFTNSFAPGSLKWTNIDTSIYTFTQTGSETYTATYIDSGVIKTFFTIEIKENGTYDFHLETPSPSIVTITPPLFSGITGGSNLTSYTFDASKFGGAFSLVLTATSGAANDPAKITISSTDLGINGNSIQQQFNEILKLDVVQQQGFDNASVTSLTVDIASTGSLKTGDKFDLDIVYKGGTTTPQTVTYDGSGKLVFAIDPSLGTVDYVTLHVDSGSPNVNFKITGIELNYSTEINPADNLLNFSLTGADADHDSATAIFTVDVIAGTAGNDIINTGAGNDTVSGGAGNDTINGGAGNDTLIGGQGNDILTGGLGSDTFKWNFGDQGTSSSPAADHITDFNLAPLASGGDILDLKDLLTDEHANAASLDAYLDFSANSTGQTVIAVHIAGAGSPVTQTITLDNVQFSALQTYAGGTTDVAIITKLLADGHLKTDV